MSRTDGSTKRWALVLAGGDGTRLQELTRSITGVPIPKQYCRLLGDRSLLEATLARAQRFAPPERTAVILNRNHLDVGREHIHQLPAENILVQPHNCDTGPGLLFALLQLARRAPRAIVAVFPSDHYIGDDAVFMTYVQRAAWLAGQLPDKIVILGIHPDRPEPGFGYIMPGQQLPTDAAQFAAFRVSEFHEKPRPEVAAMLLAADGLWNSFVMVFRIDRMLQLLEAIMPAEFSHLHAVRGNPISTARAYTTVVPWNFSNGMLARIPEHLVVLRVEGVQWSDWGTPEAIRRTLLSVDQPPMWFMQHRQSDMRIGA